MIYRNIPKCERYGLGAKIDALFLELLDTSQKARYLSPEKKIPLIEDSLSYIDSIKFFIQYAWEAKIISEKQFADIGQDMEDIGRMTGGWRRGLLTKTSDHLTEEKK